MAWRKLDSDASNINFGPIFRYTVSRHKVGKRLQRGQPMIRAMIFSPNCPNFLIICCHFISFLKVVRNEVCNLTFDKLY